MVLSEPELPGAPMAHGAAGIVTIIGVFFYFEFGLGGEVLLIFKIVLMRIVFFLRNFYTVFVEGFSSLRSIFSIPNLACHKYQWKDVPHYAQAKVIVTYRTSN